jgi:uncharacterized double-CXXCG motif protein
MNFYRLTDDDDFRSSYSFRLSRQWNLPGVICSACGATWGMIGVIYPAFDLPEGLDPKDYVNRWPVPIGRFKELQKDLCVAWNKNIPIPPGLEFGASVGTVRGKLGDFAWENSWCGFISKAALNALCDRGFQLMTREPKINWSRGAFEFLEIHIGDFVELDAPGWAELLAERCNVCGRLDHSKMNIDDAAIQESSMPEGKHIFRIKDWPTYIIVSEYLATTIRELCLTDAKLTEFPRRAEHEA